MPVPAALRRFPRLGWKAAARLAFLPPLLTRLVVGQAFFFAGRGKLQNHEGVASFFADLGIPFPDANAALVSRLEYFGGLLLVAGLLTRLVALLLGSTMVVALLTADRAALTAALFNTGEAGLTDVVPVVYLLFLSWVVFAGPGAVSLDALLKRWRRRGSADEDVPAVARRVA